MRAPVLLLGFSMLSASAAMAADPVLTAPPPGAPALNEVETATVAALGQTSSPGAGLVPMRDGAGDLMVLGADGAYAGAWYDGAGNTIISFQGAERTQQSDVALRTLSGIAPGDQPAFTDALAYARQVVALTAAQGRDPNRVYVTGFSEGGMLASFVAWQTGLGGVSFASSGLPGYQAGPVPASNFFNFVESDDPIAQYGTDTVEKASASLASPRMDHYGTVLPLERTTPDMASFATLIANGTIPELQDGAIPLTPDQYDIFMGIEGGLQAEYHNLPLYFTDATALAASYGID